MVDQAFEQEGSLKLEYICVLNHFHSIKDGSMTLGILSPGLVTTCVVLANIPSFDSFLTDQAIGTMSAVPRETYDRDGNVRVQQVKLAILRCIFNSL